MTALEAGLALNAAIGDAQRKAFSIGQHMAYVSEALSVSGNEKLALQLDEWAVQIQAMTQRISDAYGDSLAAENRQQMEGVANIFTALLSSADRSGRKKSTRAEP